MKLYKPLFLSALLLLPAGMASAQVKDITPDMLKQFRQQSTFNGSD